MKSGVSVTLAQHRDSTQVKNVPDNHDSAYVEGAKNNIIMCKTHPGKWMTKPRHLGFSVKVRDCPDCSIGVISPTNSVSSIDTSDTNNTTSDSSTFSGDIATQPLNPNNKFILDTSSTFGGDTSSPLFFSKVDTLLIPFVNGTYSGGVKAGTQIKHGKGVMKLDSGWQYKGIWDNDAITGKGVMRYENGEIYEGAFKNGFRHGYGKMKYINKEVYTGAWVKDKRYGYGIMNFLNRDVYKGYFLEDKVTGRGKYFYNNTDEKYNGYMVDCIRHGYGVLKYPNGDVYSGKFKENKKNGYGVYVERGGETYQGLWYNDLKQDKIAKVIDTKGIVHVRQYCEGVPVAL